MRNYILALFSCLLILLSSSFSFSQNESKKIAIASSKANIKKLKNGCLLVQLFKNENKLKALQKAGKDKEYEKLKNEVNEEHKGIMLSFYTVYDFSKVYFFYNTDATQIINGNYKGILFDKDFKPVDYSVIKYKNVFTLQVGDVFADAFKDDIQGIVVMDREMNQLQRPFPYYVKKYRFPKKARTMPEMVELLNTNLTRYYKASE